MDRVVCDLLGAGRCDHIVSYILACFSFNSNCEDVSSIPVLKAVNSPRKIRIIGHVLLALVVCCDCKGCLLDLEVACFVFNFVVVKRCFSGSGDHIVCYILACFSCNCDAKKCSDGCFCIVVLESADACCKCWICISIVLAVVICCDCKSCLLDLKVTCFVLNYIVFKRCLSDSCDHIVCYILAFCSCNCDAKKCSDSFFCVTCLKSNDACCKCWICISIVLAVVVCFYCERCFSNLCYCFTARILIVRIGHNNHDGVLTNVSITRLDQYIEFIFSYFNTVYVICNAVAIDWIISQNNRMIFAIIGSIITFDFYRSLVLYDLKISFLIYNIVVSCMLADLSCARYDLICVCSCICLRSGNRDACKSIACS